MQRKTARTISKSTLRISINSWVSNSDNANAFNWLRPTISKSNMFIILWIQYTHIFGGKYYKRFSIGTAWAGMSDSIIYHCRKTTWANLVYAWSNSLHSRHTIVWTVYGVSCIVYRVRYLYKRMWPVTGKSMQFSNYLHDRLFRDINDSAFVFMMANAFAPAMHAACYVVCMFALVSNSASAPIIN